METILDIDLFNENNFGTKIITNRSNTSNKSNYSNSDNKSILKRREYFNKLNSSQKTGYFFIPNQK